MTFVWMRTAVFVLATVFALSGCDFVGEIFEGERTWEGRVAWGFEVAAFSPCGSGQSWWLVGDDEAINELYDRYRALGLDEYEYAYARLKGSRSPEGEYGHLGAYSREFDVQQVIEVRELEEGECE